MSSPQHPGTHIRENILPKGMKVTEAAKLLGVGRPALSNMLNGNAALSAEMAGKVEKAFGASAADLLQMQLAFDAATARSSSWNIATRKYVAPFLQIKAGDFEDWVHKRIIPRTRLAVLLRTLVNSTGAGLTLSDFPGNDDAEQPGWDGFVEAPDGTPWVPGGRSGWEFGVNADIKKKADGDIAKSAKATPATERASITFVFVTPRRWAEAEKDKWVAAQRAKKEWKDVRAYDAVDLEQWIEQSLSAQAWFAAETGRPSNGVRTLSDCWRAWQADCAPPLHPAIFDEPLHLFGKSLIGHLNQPGAEPILLTANSEIEALAYLACLFELPENASLGDRVLVFSDADALRKLALGSTDFIPVIVGPEVQIEFAPLAGKVPAILVETPKTTTTPTFKIEPLSDDAFDAALTKMGCSREEARNLSRRSGRVLTVLRRQLSHVPAIRNPDWASDQRLARNLVPFVFAGAWRGPSPHARKGSGEEDLTIVSLLAEDASTPALEQRTSELLKLEDPPVWSVGQFRGVVSKMDALFAIAPHITTADIRRFLDVALLVLSEDDPALDLPEDKRWMANVYEKTRSISGALRAGISETLILLGVYGDQLLNAHTGMNLDAEVRRLIRQLLVPGDARVFEAQANDLPMYAEAAPGEFLDIIERDLDLEESGTHKLMRPMSSSMFGSSPRVGLLWALENIAWSPDHLIRVVDVLARLAVTKLDDNLVHKPIESLSAIFRARMPQTGGNLALRKEALDYLVTNHPQVAWPLCVEQFDLFDRVGHYSHRPRWRPDARGHGEPVVGPDPREFSKHALELALSWSSYSVAMLGDLVQNIEALHPTYRTRVWELIVEWSKTASDADRATLRERLRTTFARRSRRPEDGETQSRRKVARQVLKALEPTDLIQKHAWLFREAWVEFAADELDDDIDFKRRDEQIEEKRIEALDAVLRERGLNGITALAATGSAHWVVGRLLFRILESHEARLNALCALEVLRASSEPGAEGVFGGLLIPMSDEEIASALTSLAAGRCEEEVVELCLRAPFREAVWDFAELDPAVASKFWARCHPMFGHPDEDMSRVTKRLLDAGRPLPAFAYVRHRLKAIPAKLLHRILDELKSTHPLEGDSNYRLDQHWVGEAFEILTKSGEISVDEMAALEFAYIEALPRKGDIPNLEQKINEDPALFVHFVALLYRRNDGQEDPAHLRPDDADAVKRRANAAYHVFKNLKRIPGWDASGAIQTDRLEKWVQAVRVGCAELGRKEACDSQLGELFAKAPPGSDGIWPAESARPVVEQISSEQFASGVTVGLHNNRGVHWRGEGGDDERKLADTYRRGAEALRSRFRRISKLLTDMAASYEAEAQWHDTEAGVRRRLQ